MKKRQDHEPPWVIAEEGWRFHHLGIPTDEPRPGETYLAAYKLYVSGFDKSPYGVEWMRSPEAAPRARPGLKPRAMEGKTPEGV